MVIPVRDLSPRGTVIGKKCSPQAFGESSQRNFFVGRTGMKSYSSTWNFPLLSLGRPYVDDVFTLQVASPTPTTTGSGSAEVVPFWSTTMAV
jgi:hypothetical protein